MRYFEIITEVISPKSSDQYAPQITAPRMGARSFGVSLSHLYFHLHKDGKDDVVNFDYLDNAADSALRYRFMVGRHWLAFLHDMLPQITAAGWHLTSETKRARNQWQLVFEPITAPRVPRDGIFWHLSPRSNVASIKQHGLIPKNSRHGFT
jgi:hypothetical protein